MSESLLDLLVEEELGSVVFVMDYLLLDFSAARFTAYVWPVVTIGEQTTHFGTGGYRDALCSFIGHEVTSANASPTTGLAIRFSTGQIVTKPALVDLEGPEIAMLMVLSDSFRDEAWQVWRPGEGVFEAIRGDEP